MNFEVIESRVTAFENWAVRRFDLWWLERKIRVANTQVRLAEESMGIALQAAGEWRGYAARLKDVRKARGFPDRGNDWKPPMDWLTVGLVAMTLSLTSIAVAVAMMPA